MKNINYLLVFFLSLSSFPHLLAQDTLSLKALQPFSHSFDIQNGELVGKGAEVLTTAIANAHIMMLGDENRSPLEAEFTQALIRELNHVDYKTMVLETGPTSGQIIKRLSKTPETTVSTLKALNRKYSFEINERVITPIPDFKSIKAAQFIQAAGKENWEIFSIGNESWAAYKMLCDELFANLSVANQNAHQKIYQECLAFLDLQYASMEKVSNAEVLKFITALKNSTLLNKFLTQMSIHNKNKAIVKAFQFSLNHWEMYGNRAFYPENGARVQDEKERLSQALQAQNFDFKEDKLFIRMWLQHLTNGVTRNGFYGVGNMLKGMASYHGHTSLNIAMIRRFYQKDKVIKDRLSSNDLLTNNMRKLLQLGKKEEWVLVDLRPMIKEFYWGPTKLDPEIEKLIFRYDMLVIPKMDLEGSINY